MNCIYEDCTMESECSCSCDSHPKSLCLDHLQAHIQDSPNKEHNLELLLDESLSQEEKIFETRNKIKILTYKKSIFLQESSRAIKQLIDNASNNLSFYDQLSSKYSQQINEKFTVENQTEKNLSLIEKSNFFLSHESTIYDEIKENEYFGYFVLKDPMVAHLVSAKDGNTITVPFGIKLPAKMDYNYSFCPLPGNKFICFEQLWERHHQGVAFILHGPNNIQMINPGTPSCFPGLAYLNGCVYKFGSRFRSSKFESICEKYDIAKNKWFKLSSMIGLAVESHTCAVFNKKILYSWK